MSAPPPDLASILADVRRIELITRGIVRATVGGEYHSVFKGQGIDFDDFREYQAGDEVRSIDWNVTARQGTPFIRKYVEERELTVFVAVDVSASMNYGSKSEAKRHLAARVAALFAFSAIYNQDKVGLLLFSDEIELYLPPAKSRLHSLRLIREILTHQPRRLRSDATKALDFLTNHIARRSLILFISDFDNGRLPANLRTAAIRHDIVALQVADPAENTLPSAGRLRIADPETGEEIVINTSNPRIRAQYHQLRQEWQESLDRTFKTCSIDKISVQTGEDYQPALHGFFKRREKRGR